ncbi:jg2156, partial [Pararge aegeria aegeria]
VDSITLFDNSLKRALASGPHGSKVSTPKGTKMKQLSRFSYLRLLACSALEAAAPTIDEVAWMCEAARVSTQVASHRRLTFQASKQENLDGVIHNYFNPYTPHQTDPPQCILCARFAPKPEHPQELLTLQ